ncbi:MAG: alpha-glucan family phosphorylase [Zavarzinella sp.]
MSKPVVRTFTVLPKLPDQLKKLDELAKNLWWSWHPEAVALFQRIDPDQFEQLDHSPIRLLGKVSTERFEELAKDRGFLAHMDRVAAAFEEYMSTPSWFSENHADANDLRIAYFSAEFGIHESVPVYSGGLGVLAGDHLKSASDLGIPLCGVSLMYREGYFRQYLNADGWQQERYPENDFFTLPLIAEVDEHGKPATISVELPGRSVFARVWRIQVGRVPLYLLDCNIPENNAHDRGITARLYGGDKTTRIEQEIILGIGGLRALRMLGKKPTVAHMNEGHSAFCALERASILIADMGLNFEEAIEVVKAGTVFTTHTPVPAGNETFSIEMIDRYFGEYYTNRLKISRDQFLSLGQDHSHSVTDKFSMTLLAINTSNLSNGVSKLHGVVAREMWQANYPGVPKQEVPITSITNGVHTLSWVAPEIARLYDRYLGRDWQDKPTYFEVWKKVESIPDAELWRSHCRRREALVSIARSRLAKQLTKKGALTSDIKAAEEVLDPDALTIGFARRFATYKRGNLIFRNMERLKKILHNTDRPVQFIFSGKAHPMDDAGKKFIQEVAQRARMPELARRVLFLEDYDMNVARVMVQGVDVWLNNPRRPLEASGTSGMKVCANGGINLSVLDGWWDEGYRPDNGWRIGNGEELADEEYQDLLESNALYDLIEREVVPEFYNRSIDGIPRGWTARMKKSISTNVAVFNTNRMVCEYTEVSYLPAHTRLNRMRVNQYELGKNLAAWRASLLRHWQDIRVESIQEPQSQQHLLGEPLELRAKVHLGSVLKPKDVSVQMYYGPLDSFGQISNAKVAALEPVGGSGPVWDYQLVVPCCTSGQYGYSIRVLPHHTDLPSPFDPALILWS